MIPKKLALLVKEAAADKQAENPVIIDLQKYNNVSRYFVIVHGNSYPHVKAIAENVIEKAEAKGVKTSHIEGMDDGLWVLIDFGFVIVHVFYRTTRDFYGLERLWGDAPTL